jgi:carbonic anhydrase
MFAESLKPSDRLAVAMDAATTGSSLLDELLAGNRHYVAEDWESSDAELAAPPAKRLAVVACMDTRHNVERVLGLKHGDAKIIRNAGNLIDDGTLRSLIVAVHLLEVKHVAVMGHTKCGMTLVGRGEFRIARHISATTGVALHEVMRPDFQRWLGGVADVEQHVREGVTLLRNHPYMPKDLNVFGLVYDNDTGLVKALR